MESRVAWVPVDGGEAKVREKKVVLRGGLEGVLEAEAVALLDRPPTMGPGVAPDAVGGGLECMGVGKGEGSRGREPLVPVGRGERVGSSKGGAMLAVTLPEVVRVRVEEGELDKGTVPLVPVGSGEAVGAALLKLLGDTS